MLLGPGILGSRVLCKAYMAREACSFDEGPAGRMQRLSNMHCRQAEVPSMVLSC